MGSGNLIVDNILILPKFLLRKKLAAWITLASIIITTPLPSMAETLKRKVIEDCAAAKLEAATLPAKEQTEFVSYLTLVLKMNLAADIAPVPGKTADVWRTFDTKHESQAKRCALSILQQFAGTSISAIPDLLRLYENKAFDLSDTSLNEVLSETILSIVSAVGNSQSQPLPATIVPNVIALLNTPAKPYAEEVLIRLPNDAIPALLQAIKSPDAPLRDKIFGVLFKIDSGGLKVGPELVKLLQAEDDGLRKRTLLALSHLPDFYSVSLPLIIGRLNDLSSEVQETAVDAIEEVLSQPKESLAKIHLTKEGESELVRALGKLTGKRREIIGNALVLIESPGSDVERDLVRLYDTGEDSVKVFVLSVLGRRAKLGNEAIGRIKAAMLGASDSLRTAAIDASGYQNDRQAEVLEAMTRLMQKTGAQSDVGLRQRIYTQVASAITRLNPGAAAFPLLKYFVEALSYSTLDLPSVITGKEAGTEVVGSAIAQVGTKAVPALVSAAKSSNILTRQRVARTFGNISPETLPQITALTTLLSDSDQVVRSNARDSLTSLGKDVKAPVEKLLKAKLLGTRIAAAEVLFGVGSYSPPVQVILKEGLEQATCAEAARMAQKLSKQKTDLDQIVPRKLIECLKQSSGIDQTKLVSLLVAYGPLTPEDAKSVLVIALSKSLDRTIQFEMLEHFVELGIPPADVLSVVEPLFRSDDNSVKYRAIGLLGAIGDAAISMVDPLQDLRKDSGQSDLLKHEAIVAIAKIAPTAFDYAAYFRTELESGDMQWVEKSLRRMGPKLAIPFLVESLKSPEGSVRKFALKNLSFFAVDAGPYITSIQEAKNDPDSTVARAAEETESLVKKVARVDPTPANLPVPDKGHESAQ